MNIDRYVGEALSAADRSTTPSHLSSLFEDISYLIQTGTAKRERVAAYLKSLGEEEVIANGLRHEVLINDRQSKSNNVTNLLAVAEAVGLDDPVYDYLQSKYQHPNVRPASPAPIDNTETANAQPVKPRPKKPLSWKKRLALGAAALATASVPLGGAAVYATSELGRHTSITPVTYDTSKVFRDLPKRTVFPPAEEGYDVVKPIPPPTPKAEPKLTATPDTPNAKEVIGEANMAEFFFGNLLEKFKYRRQERYLFDPAAKERLFAEYINSDQLTFLYVGTDETRERYMDWTGSGRGRGDVIMLISFNPHNFKTAAISLPRDLFTPELKAYLGKYPRQLEDGGARINNIIQLPQITSDPNAEQPLDILRRVVESATGIPVDGIIKTNIDSMQGYQEKDSLGNYQFYPGIFDILFPNGLSIFVNQTINDTEYPVGYGTKRLYIPQGRHQMKGRQLTEWVRTRHGESDFKRGEKARQALISSLGVFLQEDLINFLLTGDLSKMDALISFLEREQQLSNLYYDETDFVEIMKTVRDNIATLRETPKGIAALTALARNSADEVSSLVMDKEHTFFSFGPDREGNRMVENVGVSEQFYKPFMLKVSGSTTTSRPAGNGTYLNYWQPVRNQAKAIFDKLGV